MPFPYTVDQIVDAYRRRGVKAKACTWRQDETCMCPMSMLAVDKLAGEGSVVDGIKRFDEAYRTDGLSSTGEVVSRVIGCGFSDVLSFLEGFDLGGGGMENVATVPEAFELAVEARARLKAEGLFVN